MFHNPVLYGRLSDTATLRIFEQLAGDLALFAQSHSLFVRKLPSQRSCLGIQFLPSWWRPRVSEPINRSQGAERGGLRRGGVAHRWRGDSHEQDLPSTSRIPAFYQCGYGYPNDGARSFNSSISTAIRPIATSCISGRHRRVCDRPPLRVQRIANTN